MITQPNRVYRTVQPLILASASPRRRELLLGAGLHFDVVASGIEEAYSPQTTPEALVEHWAWEKARAVARQYSEAWVIGADTIVWIDGKMLGKPADAQEAFRMLKQLSGRTHEVFSGVCLMHDGHRLARVQSVRTQVLFRVLRDSEIEAYIATGHPLDKAGAYGIQGIGAFLVQAVYGSYTNVVGLPLSETLEVLVEQGVIDVAL